MNPLGDRFGAVRARYLFREVVDRGFDLPLASVTRDGGVEYRADLHISVWNPADDTSLYRRVQPGDFVIGLRSFQSGIGYSPIEGIVSPAYTVLRPISEISADYYRHLFKSMAFISILANVSQGIRQGKTISAEDFYDLRLPRPAMRDQRRIADYLDGETARIDALIEKKQRMIELGNEALEADIFFRTTRGLGDDVRLKRVRLDWIGEIPVHWELPSLGARYEVQLGKMLNPTASEGPDRYPYLRNVNVQWDRIDTDDLLEMHFDASERQRLALRPGDLLACEGGEVGRAAVWDGQLGNCFFQKALHRVRPLIEGNTRFLMYCLRAAARRNVFAIEGNQSTIVHLTAEQLRVHRFPWPPLREQAAITAYLDRASERHRRLTQRLERQIDLLRERRQTLVTAAVTGQLEVTKVAT